MQGEPLLLCEVSLPALWIRYAGRRRVATTFLRPPKSGSCRARPPRRFASGHLAAKRLTWEASPHPF